MRHLISIKGLSAEQIEKLFSAAERFKKRRRKIEPLLSGKSIGLIFQKPSNRTRVSFEVACFELGARCIYLGPEDIKLGQREEVRDIARVLSRYLHGLVARTTHQYILDLAEYSTIPVINGLTDFLHPCQALSDLFTIKEKKGKLKGVRLAYVGDGNNVLHSLLYGASKLGVELRISAPSGYGPDKKVLEEAKGFAAESDSKISFHSRVEEAVSDSDVIYTDVWISMGQEEQRQRRLKDFQGFQVNQELVSKAKGDCLVMHCLPCHRDEEITDGVIEGPNSIVFEQAENRLYVQKAILSLLLGGC